MKDTGKRFLANHADDPTLQQLSDTTAEQIGKTGVVTGDSERKGRNLFTLDKRSNL